jgi:hypothetical protein
MPSNIDDPNGPVGKHAPDQGTLRQFLKPSHPSHPASTSHWRMPGARQARVTPHAGQIVGPPQTLTT